MMMMMMMMMMMLTLLLLVLLLLKRILLLLMQSLPCPPRSPLPPSWERYEYSCTMVFYSSLSFYRFGGYLSNYNSSRILQLMISFAGSICF